MPPVQEKNSFVFFAFQAASWPRCFGFPVTLHQVFRQENQGKAVIRPSRYIVHLFIEFVDMLNSMRRGIVTPEITERMNQLEREIVYDDGIEPTDL